MAMTTSTETKQLRHMNIEELAAGASEPFGEAAVLQRYAQTVRKHGLFADAITVLLPRLEAEPDNIYLVDLLRRFCARAGATQQALAMARSLCRLEPAIPEHALARGRLAARLGLNDEAEESYQTCLRLDPNHQRGLHSFAQLMMRKKDWAATSDLLARLIELDPADVLAWSLNARLKVKLGEIDHSTEVVTSGIRAVVSSGHDRLPIATILDSIGLHRESAALAHRFAGRADANLDSISAAASSAFRHSDVGTAMDLFSQMGKSVTWQRQEAQQTFLVHQMCSALDKQADRGFQGTHPFLTITRFAADVHRTNAGRFRTIEGDDFPPRLIMAISTLRAGGAERQFMTTAAGLHDRGADLRIFASNAGQEPAGGFFGDNLSLAGVPVVEPGATVSLDEKLTGTPCESLLPLLRIMPGPEADQLATYIRLFEDERPTVLQVWQDASGVIASVAALLTGVPRIIICTRSLAPDRKVGRNRVYLRDAYREILALPHVHLFNNSAAGAADYRRWLDLPGLEVGVIENGFDFAAIDALRDETAVADNRKRVLTRGQGNVVGGVLRFSEEKRPDLWLETAALLRSRGHDWSFVMIGDGPMRPAMETYARSLGLDGHVTFLGNRKDVHCWYPAFDALLLTSRVEGLPNVLVEAQAHGVPVVTTDVGGARQTLQDGTTGFAVVDAQADDLAERLERLLVQDRDPVSRSRQCRDFVEERFGIDRMIERTWSSLFGGPNAL